MELDELKIIWTDLEKKIDRNWNLNVELLKTAKFDKAKSKMKQLTLLTSMTLFFYISMTLFFIIYTTRNPDSIFFMISGYVLALWSLMISFGSMRQLDLIYNIDYAEAIPVLQRRLEKIKLVILEYIRLAQWIFPFYLAFVIFWSKFIFDFDIVVHAGKNWMIAQVIFSTLLLPVCYWIHKKLDPRNINKKWVNTLLQGSGSQVSDALDFIGEIERFERS